MVCTEGCCRVCKQSPFQHSWRSPSSCQSCHKDCSRSVSCLEMCADAERRVDDSQCRAETKFQHSRMRESGVKCAFLGNLARLPVVWPIIASCSRPVALSSPETPSATRTPQPHRSYPQSESPLGSSSYAPSSDLLPSTFVARSFPSAVPSLSCYLLVYTGVHLQTQHKHCIETTNRLRIRRPRGIPRVGKLDLDA